MKVLARFRADPSEARVSVRRERDDFFVATVASRKNPILSVSAKGRTARAAILRALRCAAEQQVPGVDRGMQWAYAHPWKATAS